MRDLPLDHPGVPAHRSAGRLLWWLAKGQWHTLLLGMLFGIAQESTTSRARCARTSPLAAPPGATDEDILEALDAARHLERWLAAVLQGRTVIAIAHRSFSAHDADRVAVVEEGRAGTK